MSFKTPFERELENALYALGTPLSKRMYRQDLLTSLEIDRTERLHVPKDPFSEILSPAAPGNERIIEMDTPAVCRREAKLGSALLQYDHILVGYDKKLFGGIQDNNKLPDTQIDAIIAGALKKKRNDIFLEFLEITRPRDASTHEDMMCLLLLGSETPYSSMLELTADRDTYSIEFKEPQDIIPVKGSYVPQEMTKHIVQFIRQQKLC